MGGTGGQPGALPATFLGSFLNYLFERKRKHGWRGGRENPQADSPLPAEPSAGLDPGALRPRAARTSNAEPTEPRRRPFSGSLGAELAGTTTGNNVSELRAGVVYPSRDLPKGARDGAGGRRARREAAGSTSRAGRSQTRVAVAEEDEGRTGAARSVCREPGGPHPREETRVGGKSRSGAVPRGRDPEAPSGRSGEGALPQRSGAGCRELLNRTTTSYGDFPDRDRNYSPSQTRAEEARKEGEKLFPSAPRGVQSSVPTTNKTTLRIAAP